MKFGIVVFPGTWSDTDTKYAVNDILGYDSCFIWHQSTDLQNSDVVVLPGGFSYGDYLRAGAIARFSPVMTAVREFADRGGTVMGVCNGFQILCEARLLPGTLIRNSSLQFRCRPTNLRVEKSASRFTKGVAKGSVLKIPVSHAEGNYQADSHVLDELEQNDRVLFRYSNRDGQTGVDDANPNGSANDIAGIVNKRGNVLGMMPHPERACSDLLGSGDGNLLFKSAAGAV